MEVITKVSHAIGYVVGVTVKIVVASFKIVSSFFKFLSYLGGRFKEGYNRNS